jgi:hypothetical protein
MTNKDEWLTQQLRISVFPTQGSLKQTTDLFPKGEGIDYVNETTNPKTGESTKEGSFKRQGLAAAGEQEPSPALLFARAEYDNQSRNGHKDSWVSP